MSSKQLHVNLGVELRRRGVGLVLLLRRKGISERSHQESAVFSVSLERASHRESARNAMFPSTFSQSDQCTKCSLVSVSERSLYFLVCVCTRLRNRSQPVGRCSRHDHLLNRNESLHQQHLPEKLSPNIRPRPRARLRTRMKPQMRGLDCISD